MLIAKVHDSDVNGRLISIYILTLLLHILPLNGTTCAVRFNVWNWSYVSHAIINCYHDHYYWYSLSVHSMYLCKLQFVTVFGFSNYILLALMHYYYCNPHSVGIDLKELGGSRCRNVWNFAQGLKFKADFYSKMSVCRHELGGSTSQPPDNSNPEPTIAMQLCMMQWRQ